MKTQITKREQVKNAVDWYRSIIATKSEIALVEIAEDWLVNERLFAAAPELLEACKAVLENEYKVPQYVYELAQQAIAKAEGK